MRVLVIEDDREAAAFLVKGLEESGYAVDHAGDGTDGLHLAANERYDVMIVDRMLPGLDGLSLVQTLRSEGKRTPILILSALGEVNDRVDGLRKGGDDYLVKPFAFSELAARIRAVSRRESTVLDPVLSTRGLDLDPNTNTVRRDGVSIHLTPKEFELLYYLAKHEGRAIPQEELIERIWDERMNPFTQTVKVHMNNLRRKLNEGFDEQMITTIRGKGYVL